MRFSVIFLLGALRRTSGEDSLSHVWNEIVSKSANTAQCQTCVHLRNYQDQTLPDHEIKNMRIEALKQTILKKLGMTQPPKFSSPSKPLPHPIKDGTLSLEKERLIPFQHVTERVIILFAHHECAKDVTGYRMSLKLDIPANLQGIDIDGANMWVYTGLDLLESCQMVTSSCGNDASDLYEIPIMLSSFKGGWSKMDITWTLSNWLEMGTFCHNIELTCTFPRICEKVISDDPSKKPFIHVDIAPNNFQHVRDKRNINCGKGTTECCRESLLVSFKEIGWDDWIIQPTDYNAFFCKGTCANAATISLSKAPYHTVMRKYNGITHKHSDVIPCCTPARLSPLQVIYKDQNNTYFQRLIPDLTVDSCGCM